MSTLDSSSTVDDIKAAYWNNASYQEDNSLTKCKAFVTACRLLLSLPMSTTSTIEGRNESISFDMVRIQNELNAANAWLSINDTYSGVSRQVKHLSFEDFR